MAPIHHAASAGDVETLRQLLESGESPDALYHENAFYLTQTPLHCLCERNGGDRAACFELLRDAGANLEASDSEGYRPLHFAARSKSVELVSLLVQARVNVDAATNDGSTALHFAARKGAADCVKVLLAAIAPYNVDATDRDGVTALHLAARRGGPDCVEVLLAAGASLNLREVHSGRTPFEHALHYSTWSHATPEQRARCRRTWPLFLRAGAGVPAIYTDNMGAEVPTDNMDPYLVRVRNAGGFQRYSQQHLARITSILETPLLPPELVRKVLEFWLHAGYYDFEPPPQSGGGSSDGDDDSEDDSDSDYYTD